MELAFLVFFGLFILLFIAAIETISGKLTRIAKAIEALDYGKS